MGAGYFFVPNFFSDIVVIKITSRQVSRTDVGMINLVAITNRLVAITAPLKELVNSSLLGGASRRIRSARPARRAQSKAERDQQDAKD
jgi:hypothetical protein